MEKQSTILINGKWLKSPLEGVPSYNPATKKVIGYYSDATIELTEQAIQYANNSFKSWRRVPIPKRAEYLKIISDRLQVNREALAQLITLEMGKPLRESLAEVDAAIRSAEYFAGKGRDIVGEILPSNYENRNIKVVRTPIGVTGCITPWNYPVSLAAHKIFSALIAGNTIVLKPSPEVVFTSKLFVELISTSGIPEGVINLLTSQSYNVGKYIVDHPLVPLITFTGSTKVGVEIAKSSACQLKKISLELGGNNATILFPDANLEKAVDEIIPSTFGTSGQRCTATGRIIIHRDIKSQFLKIFIDKVKTLSVGDGFEKNTIVGPLINNHSLKRIDKMIDQAILDGAKVLCGGRKIEHMEGFFYEPTILDNVLHNFEIAQEEIFGPVVSLIEFDSYEEAVQINNDTKYGLSTSVFTESLSTAMKIQRDLESGLVYINAGTANAETGVPFGGIKYSGNGYREVSHDMIDFMTEKQSVYINF